MTNLPSLPAKGESLTHEGHLQGGLVHLDQGQGLGVVRAGDGVADVHLVEAGHGDQVAGGGLRDLHALKALEAQQLADAAPLDAAVVAQQGGGLAGL